ncbi:MAG: DNA replication/repair protein RecF [Thermomicrobiales bacterium]
MHLHTLTLEEFRSYHHQVLGFEEPGLAVFGENASGKSSLLEAIAMLATTRSPRTTTERELINWSSGGELGVPPFARIAAIVSRADREIEIEIVLQVDPDRPGSVKKQIKVNRRPVRAMDAVGALNAVFFSPEDVGLVTGPPAQRRRYLDLTISQLDARYLRSLARYNRILEQRNSLLKSLNRDGVSADSSVVAGQLAFWDEELIGFGSRVLARRFGVVRLLSALAAERFQWLTGGGALAISYGSTVETPEVPLAIREGSPEALEMYVGRSFSRALPPRRRDELRRGMTLMGPHRDDLKLTVAGADLAAYGSRGQQRLAVVALKLAEVDLMVFETGERPIVLLDDVLSELDERHRRMLTDAMMKVGGQLFLTTTDEATFDTPVLADLQRAHARAGQLEMHSPGESTAS